MRMRDVRVLSAGLMMLAVTTSAAEVAAQGAAQAAVSAGDPSARVAAVLPPEVARQVLAVIAEARANNLPSDAIANRSLKFAARGIAPRDIARAAVGQLERMHSARDVLRSARSGAPDGGEIEAGAEALREGVTAADVSRLVKSAPSGRSLTVPLYVMGSLVSRGLPSDEALRRVQNKLSARASDADVESVGRDVEGSHGAKGEEHERGFGEGQSGGVGSNNHDGPDGVPRNTGERGRHEKPGGTQGKPSGKGGP